MSVQTFLQSLMGNQSQQIDVFVEKISDSKTLDTLFAFLNAQIAQEQIRLRFVDRYKDLSLYPPKKREIESIKLFGVYEEFLTNNRPPIILRQYQGDALREEIKNKITTSMLSNLFQLYFLPDKEKILVLFQLTLQVVGFYMQAAVGSSSLVDLFTNITKGTIFEGIRIESN